MPKTTVAAIVTNSHNGPLEVLLTRRNVQPFKGRWCLPGGHIEPYEPARRAAIREVKEETGLDFEAQFFNYCDEIMPDHGIHAVVIVFEGQGRGIVEAEASEVAEIGWFSLAEAQALPLAFAHNKILEAYAARRGK